MPVANLEPSAIAPVLAALCQPGIEAALAAAELDEHYGVPLDVVALLQEQPRLAAALVAQPQAMLEALEDALVAAQELVLERHPERSRMAVKPNAHVRPHSLPYSLDPEPNRLSPGISAMGSAHLGRLVAIRGTVVKAGPVKMFEAQKVFACNKCKHRFILKNTAEPSSGSVAYELPLECPSEGAAPCSGANFRPDDGPGGTCYTNHQELRVQQQLQCLEPGSVPASMTVLLQDELADACQPGDDVEVTGVVCADWRPLFPGARCDGTLTLRACQLRCVSSLHRAAAPPPEGLQEQFRDFWSYHASCPLKGRNKILASVCPQIYGLFLVKLAVALTLIGGCARRDDAGAHIRGEVHMLLIGDPGTGKSQVMKFAARMAPRAVVTTGRGTTGAGLTVSAMKEGGAWSLEAGALVLADGGLCCIDEFECIREADRAMIHEAMEQQTLHIAKAGMVTTLSTRTSVLGVTNPTKGAFKHGGACAGVAATSLSGPLLSRFDVVLLLLDQHEPTWDRIVSEHVLSNHQQAAQPFVRALHGWSVEELRGYVAWAKAANPNISMDDAAEQVILAYYQQQRRAEERSQARTTIRMLESLVRVSQAHARLCARGRVGQQDAVMAVLVLDSSMCGSSLVGWSNALHTHFPEDPDAEYVMLERQVLHGLGLSHLIAGGPGGGGGGGGGGPWCGAPPGAGGDARPDPDQLLGGGGAFDWE
ncbi:MCM9 [Scenedesmus sp. PABB004]|nr:MCM9 [Scenedesmus sp. PABB004]